MTLASRNIFFVFAASIAFLNAASLAFLLLFSEKSAGVLPVARQIYWFSFSSENGNGQDLALAVLLAAQVYSFAGLVVLYAFFKKTHSPEVHYLAVYFATWILQAPRLLLYFFQDSLSSGLSVFIIQTAYYGRFAALLALFAASLYGAGLQGRGVRNALWPLFFLLYAFIVLLMFDAASPVNPFLYRLSDEEPAFMLYIALAFAVIFGYILSAVAKQSAGLGLLALASAALIFSGDFIFYASSLWLTCFGFAGLILGAFLFISQIRSRYLWSGDSLARF